MEVKNREAAFWVALSCVPLLGAVRLKKLIEVFHSAEETWKTKDDLIEKLNFPNSVKQSLLENRRKIDPESELQKVESGGFKIITYQDQEYPKLLSEIHDPPVMLYLYGQISALRGTLFAVVGTRKVTSYGERVVDYFIHQLVFRGLTIVSGMARGIDSLVHSQTLENQGKTVAVLGSGLDIIYPPENRKLAERIIEKGALISEYPLGTPPLRQNFPVRNRLISGLSVGLLVVEAAEKSGTLITVQQALAQNRKVFAVPGSIFNPLSKGTLKLIKSGAKPVETIDDIMDELNLGQHITDQKKPAFIEIVCQSNEEKLICKALVENEALSIDEIKRKTGLSMALVNSILTKMEIRGTVINSGGAVYALKKS